MSIRPKHNFKGFTLVELLVALMITSIVLTAVATLAYAVGRANDSSEDTAVKPAQLRYATLRISELIRHSKHVCAATANHIELWLADVNEPAYIDVVPTGDGYLKLQLREGSGDAVVLIPQCSNVQFLLDSAPQDTKFVSISFELEENDVWHEYQISATLRCKAG